MLLSLKSPKEFSALMPLSRVEMAAAPLLKLHSLPPGRLKTDMQANTL